MLECKPCDTPVVKESRASIHNGVLLENPAEYRTLVGSLQYLTMTRPDIAFGFNYVSQFMHAPTDIHFLLVKRILRYLKGTIGLGLTLRKGDLSSVKAYIDSDWAGCPDTRRSTSDYAVFIGSSLICWSSKKQPTVSRSSAEAEYKRLSAAASELEWLSNVFKELHTSVNLSMQVFCDNTSAICLASNPVFHARAKHIEVQYHVARDRDCVHLFFFIASSIFGDTSSAAVEDLECQHSSCIACEEELSADNNFVLFSGLAFQ
ncbi:uncharacterized protein LOC113342441 [Papaver somniferum]|uniref:uncharacterized protein LOC113342441 n=1 Tax=Papaver somniferum TaxID=3469 RepID=UPI000E6F8DF9|nr:uncharacterized protein LOC113342441 [Papaver somniferum]